MVKRPRRTRGKGRWIKGGDGKGIGWAGGGREIEEEGARDKKETLSPRVHTEIVINGAEKWREGREGRILG
jgi:hypothetical protein